MLSIFSCIYVGHLYVFFEKNVYLGPQPLPFLASLMAYGNFQARDQIQAAAITYTTAATMLHP